LPIFLYIHLYRCKIGAEIRSDFSYFAFVKRSNNSESASSGDGYGFVNFPRHTAL